MGKRIKAGEKGEASQYITRTRAIRKLQITLKDFRRLCILKGIYPREPKKKFEGNTKTYYHTKDINFLAHDRLIDKFRMIKTHLKKYRRAKSRGEKERALEIKGNLPKLSLDYLVKERYPTFIDAIRDLDDPLCLINLFAAFPSHKLYKIPRARVEHCMRLSREFQLYVIHAKALRKVFFSIKGVYFQVEILGQLVTWITPYPLTHDLPSDVDYRIMMTFLEFYETLVKFTNFKLYSLANLSYPPAIDHSVESSKSYTYTAYTLQGKQLNAEEKYTKEKYENNNDFAEKTAKKDANKDQAGKGTNLFKNMTFYLARETPKLILEFIILSFGGQVMIDDENSFVDLKNPKITHIVTDREQQSFIKNKEYIQPQWLCDSVNNGMLLPVDEYLPGKVLPPHLSPFVDTAHQSYVPKRQQELEAMKGNGTVMVDENAEGEEDKDDEELEGMQPEEDSEEEYDFEEDQKKSQKKLKDEQEEEKKRSQNVMSKKARRILQKIEFGKEKERQKAEKLKEKAKLRKKMEKAEKSA